MNSVKSRVKKHRLKNYLCTLAIKILEKYDQSIILNYQIRGNIRPYYDNPVTSHFHIIGKSYLDSSSNKFKDYRS